MKQQSITAFAAALAVSSLLPSFAHSETTVRAVIEADLPTLDPVVSTGAVPRYHGHMIYETLFSKDSQLNTHPVMVDEWTVSEDGLTYSFSLRDGLAWHNGEPVQSDDVIASLQRWQQKDRTFGGMLTDRSAEYAAVDEDTFSITLSEPMPMLIDGLSNVLSPVPFIMPAEVAATSVDEPITNPIGSGPFVFEQDEWVPGSKIVYTKNENYIPRSEPTDGLAGARIANVDRVEWIIINDKQATASALRTGNIDFWENPVPEMVPLLSSEDGIEKIVMDPTGIQGLIRLNHLHPPFDNPKGREAMYWLLDQRTMLDALVNDPADGVVCGALFGCGVANETSVASEALLAHDPDKAKSLLQEAGWDFSEPLVFMHATSIPSLDTASVVFAQALRDIGLTVDLVPMDWATLTERRSNKSAPSEGGWNLFMTEGNTLAMTNPITMPLHSAACDDAWIGWPCDSVTEDLREQYANTSDPEVRMKLIEQLQERSYTVAHTHIPRGQYLKASLHSDKLTGLVSAPFAIVWWGVEKTN